MDPWLESLKPGDIVCKRRDGANGTVAKVTPAKITLEDGTRWNRETGEQIPQHKFIQDYICSPIEWKRDRLKWVNRDFWDLVPDDLIHTMFDISEKMK